MTAEERQDTAVIFSLNCDGADVQRHIKNSKDFLFLFAFTAAGVVPCGGLKTSPYINHSEFIFYFWSFEIRVNILRNQK